jgi:hypothetical protein
MWRCKKMRTEWYPESIRLTSDSMGHDGFRVVLRDLPDDGEEGSAQRGASHFHFGYRLCVRILFPETETR